MEEDGQNADNAANDMKSQFGDRVCIYTVLVGDDPAGETLMKQVAEAGGCGFSATVDRLAGDLVNMAEILMKRIFLANDLDCPNTHG